MRRYAIYGAGSLGTVLGAYITKNGGKIDHCIVTKGDFLVTLFDVGDEKVGADTSNHYPVYVKMYLVPQDQD